MEKFIMAKGTVLIVQDEIIPWDSVLHISPDGSKTTKVTFTNGHYVVLGMDIDSFKKELRSSNT
jgi:hypothetical protein